MITGPKQLLLNYFSVEGIEEKEIFWYKIVPFGTHLSPLFAAKYYLSLITSEKPSVPHSRGHAALLPALQKLH